MKAVLLAACVVVLSLIAAATIERNLTGSEETVLLAARHILEQGSTHYDSISSSRSEARGSHPPPRVLVSGPPNDRRYATSPIYAWLLAGGLALFGHSPLIAASLVNALLLATILLALEWVRREEPFASHWLIVAILLIGSVTFAQVFLVTPTMLAAALIGVACCLALEPSRLSVGVLPEIYDRGLEPRPWRENSRWASVGMLLSLAGTIEPAYWLLLVGAALALPRHRRRPAGSALATGVGLTVVLIVVFPVLLAGWAGGVHSVALGVGSTGAGAIPDGFSAPASLVQSLRASLHSPLALLGHNLYYFLLGRSLGILPYFLPVILLFTPWRREPQSRAPSIAALLATLALVVTRPFDFAGAPACVGNRLFVPIFVALWFTASLSFRRGWWLAILAASALFLYPIWLSPPSAVVPVGGHWAYPSAVARIGLPFEETQTGVPAPATVLQGVSMRVARGSLLRSRAPVVIETGGTGRAEVVLEASQPLAEVFVESSVNPPQRLETQGARLVETMFRPDGRVVYRLGLSNHGYRRPVDARSGTPVWVYDVKLVAEGPKNRAYAFALSPSAAGSWAPFSIESQ